MPELPEVETIKGQLSPALSGAKITRAIFRGSIKKPKKSLRGIKIIDVQRRGKYLLFFLTNNDVIVLHLRLTGQLLWYPGTTQQVEHAHLAARFVTDKGILDLNDARRFATLELMSITEAEEYLKSRLGVDCLAPEFTRTYFWERVQKTRKSIKSFLLEQKNFTGIGNIYADEALFLAKINPFTPTNSLIELESDRLHDAIVAKLKEGVARGGASVSDYKQTSGAKGTMQEVLQVYGRKGEACRTCGTELNYGKLGGRGTVHCPSCQSF